MGKSVVLAHGVLINALSLEGVRIGARSTIDEYAVLRGSGVIRNIGVGISVGSRTAIGARNIILGQGGVYIGNDCLLGPNVTIVSENHNISDPETPIRAQGETRASIHIDDDVWIGAGATILAGAKLGKGVVVAAGAVVRGNIDEMTIVGGVPAKLIGSRRASDAPVA
ncbi:acyltransferase [Rhodococcus sp. EPR-157]|uniref:acyltransferase n=1 Tax=Rhodococcus sp. EPR-157 TaxID=1813677 RepID=UPI0012E9048E|nr:acyltransferase [Rhodococcus sp. EPR-157]